MTDYEVELLNRLIENCIYCGGDIGGPYYTDVKDTELAIKNFLRVIDPTLDVKYIKHETFFVYRKGVCNDGI